MHLANLEKWGFPMGFPHEKGYDTMKIIDIWVFPHLWDLKMWRNLLLRFTWIFGIIED